MRTQKDRTRSHKIAQDRTRSHKIAQDRTRHLFDCALLIEYWRNAHVELRPQPAGRFYVLINVAVLARTISGFPSLHPPPPAPSFAAKDRFSSHARPMICFGRGWRQTKPGILAKTKPNFLGSAGRAATTAPDCDPVALAARQSLHPGYEPPYSGVHTRTSTATAAILRHQPALKP